MGVGVATGVGVGVGVLVGVGTGVGVLVGVRTGVGVISGVGVGVIVGTGVGVAWSPTEIPQTDIRRAIATRPPASGRIASMHLSFRNLL